jgi:hypothetical protein
MELKGIFSDRIQADLAQEFLEEFKALRVVAEKSVNKSDYVQQKELLKELRISYSKLKELERYGLRPIKFGDDSRTIWYSRRQLDEVMHAHMI